MYYHKLVVIAFALAAASAVSAQPPGESPGGGQMPPPGGASGAQQIAPPLLEMKAGEIAGRPLKNADGDTLGQVEAVARDRQTGELNAIVEIGGFLGLGQDKMAVPLSQITLADERLITHLANSRRELETRAVPWTAERFQDLADETTIADAAGTATPGGAATPGQAPVPPAASFEQLDADRDGYINVQEAHASKELLGAWGNVDANTDGRIDRGEFAVFEENAPIMQMPPPGSSQPSQIRAQPRDQQRDQDRARQRDQTR